MTTDTKTRSALVRNCEAHARQMEAYKPLVGYIMHRKGERPEKPENAEWGAYWDACSELNATVYEAARETGVGGRVFTGEGPQIVAHVDTQDVLLTDDGYTVYADWETFGDTEDNPVFYQRFDERGRYRHGWVHPVTRRIVQSG